DACALEIVNVVVFVAGAVPHGPQLVLDQLLGGVFRQFAALEAGISGLDRRERDFVDMADHFDALGGDGLVDLVTGEPGEKGVSGKGDRGKQQKLCANSKLRHRKTPQSSAESTCH